MMRQMKKLIEENPLYGRIICRCETITEGEIVEAIHRPIVQKQWMQLNDVAMQVWDGARADFADQEFMKFLPGNWGLMNRKF